MIEITTYGVLHGPAPRGDAVTVDLRNPHDDPAMRYRTGLDADVRDHVLGTPGADQVITDTVGRILAVHAWAQARGLGCAAHIYCRGGRHRSVAVAEAVVARLRGLGFEVEVVHRDRGRGRASRHRQARRPDGSGWRAERDPVNAFDQAYAIARDLSTASLGQGDNQTVTTGQVIRLARGRGLELTAAEASAAIDAASGRVLAGAR
jgi:RNase adapter protein RapZ